MATPKEANSTALNGDDNVPDFVQPSKTMSTINSVSRLCHINFLNWDRKLQSEMSMATNSKTLLSEDLPISGKDLLPATRRHFPGGFYFQLNNQKMSACFVRCR